MLKKIVIASAILITSSTVALADGAVPYVGADLGYHKSENQLTAPNQVKTNFDKNDWNGDIFAGIGTTVNQNIYLGAEGFVGLAHGDSGSKNITTATGLTTSAKLTQKYSYGISFIPGYKFNDCTMVYARAGVVRTRYDLTQNIVPAGNTSNTAEETATGGQLGIGVQTALAKNIAVRGEYDYTSYREFTSFGNKVSPRDHQIKVGLVFNLD